MAATSSNQGNSPTTQSPRDSSDLYALDLAPGEKPPAGFWRGRTVVLACALVVVAFFALDMVGTLVGNRRDQRLVEDKASLTSSRVTHVFENTADGLVERWTTTKPSDARTEGQIRRATADLLITRRNMGDFSVGDRKNLTGREVVEIGAESIDMKRVEVPGGAELRYATEDPELQAALQSWAAAQSK